MGRLVIAVYRPRPGCLPRLLEVVRDHEPALRAEGLITERAALHMQAKDGSVLEIFEWVSEQASVDAHHNPIVQALWQRFDEVAEFPPLDELDEAHQRFSHFEPLTI